MASKEAEGIALGGARGVAPEWFESFVPTVAAARPAAAATGPVAVARQDAHFRRMLLGADALALLLALLLAAASLPGSVGFGWGTVLGLGLVFAWAKGSGLYDRDRTLIHKTTLDEAPKLAQLSALCALAVWIADRPALDGSLRRGGALLLWSLLSVLLLALRAGVRSLALRWAPTERCLFLGDAQSERTVRDKLADNCGTNATIVAHLELDEAMRWFGDAFTSTRPSELRRLVRELDVHRAIVAPAADDGGDTLELVCALKAVGVRVSVLPRLLEVVGSSVDFDDLHGLTVLGVRCFALSRPMAAVKRAFDLVAASVVLLIGLPAMAAIAVAIKLDSPGPVLFRQLRVGRNGERFQIFKFRTMNAGSESMRAALAERNEACEGLFKIAADPRITKIGGLLRKTCLDELPQLLNVLRGEMSLVGPRPLVVEEDALVEGRLRRRLELLPGITGHWQILGPARVPLREMAAIDYLYVANWSLWADVKILLRTVRHVLARRGL